MSIRNDTVVIAGNIGNDPTRNETRNGKSVINFRVATSSNHLDQRTGEWVEGPTSWYDVSAFGNIAEHAKASLRRGDPVIVVGRLRVKEWDVGGGRKGTDVEITADAIGHDLSWGTSAFVRRQRATSPEQGTAGTDQPASTTMPPLAETAQTASGSGGTPPSEAPTAEEQEAWTAAGLQVGADGDTHAVTEPAYS